MSIKAAVITVPAGDNLSSPKISVMYQLRLDEVMVRPMEPWYWRPSGSVHVPPRYTAMRFFLLSRPHGVSRTMAINRTIATMMTRLSTSIRRGTIWKTSCR